MGRKQAKGINAAGWFYRQSFNGRLDRMEQEVARPQELVKEVERLRDAFPNVDQEQVKDRREDFGI